MQSATNILHTILKLGENVSRSWHHLMLALSDLIQNVNITSTAATRTNAKKH